MDTLAALLKLGHVESSTALTLNARVALGVTGWRPGTAGMRDSCPIKTRTLFWGQMKHFLAASFLAISLCGCSTISDIAVATTTASPTQAKTLSEAVQITTLVEQSLDVYVNNGSPDKAILQELQILVPAVHNSLKKAEAANASGDSALAATALAAFNEALAAVDSYETLKGVSH